MSLRCYNYQIFYPAGNDTAIVHGVDFDSKERVLISEAIMMNHKNVEQVGFVSVDDKNHIFFMAGGGFCGNGTRAAVWHFLQGKPSIINITIPDVVDNLLSGIDSDGEVWTEIPNPESCSVTSIDEGIYIVGLVGVSHIVVSPMKSRKFLRLNSEEILATAKRMLTQSGLITQSSCGVIFTSLTEKGYSITPCVHDLGVDTMIQETACGTGSIAVAIVQSIIEKNNTSLLVEQISGDIINASVWYEGSAIRKAIISGPVKCISNVLPGCIIV